MFASDQINKFMDYAFKFESQGISFYFGYQTIDLMQSPYVELLWRFKHYKLTEPDTNILFKQLDFILCQEKKLSGVILPP